ncbi:MAG: AarF/UbiB family protein [Planctomycetaceae bacterium]
MAFRPLRFLRNLRRSREIATVLLTYGFADLVDRLGLLRYVMWGKRLFFWWRKEPTRRLSRAQRIRLALESLGATFIKFGQVMSTRPDLIPADVILELEKLQESVPAFDSDLAISVIELQLNAPIDELFAEFEREPCAAGSLGQVHRAVHHNGSQLAVKIRRPKVVRKVERDLSLMLELAQLVEYYIPESQAFDPVGLVTHFSRTIRREMSYTREARTVDEFGRLFRDDATLITPLIYWDLSTDSVLTMEYIDAFRVTDTEQLAEARISRKEVAANGARIFMKQAFEFGIFHGDPHPGNIRILKDGSICLLDYGMVGMLDDEKQEQLVDLLLAISRRDTHKAVELVQRIGEPYRTIDPPLLRADVRDFVNNYYDLSLERLNVGNMLSDFVSILSTHGIRCPADLMLLIRAMVTLEGVGRELDPEFNLAEHLAPFVERIVRERYHPRRMFDRCVSEARRFLRLLHDFPINAGRAVEKIANDDMRLKLEHHSIDHLITELDRSSNRVVISVVMAALILASALILRSGQSSPWFTIPVYVLSSFLGIWLIIGIFRSGRL